MRYQSLIQKRLLEFSRFDINASEPMAWPEPFTISATQCPRLINRGSGHCVRQN